MDRTIKNTVYQLVSGAVVGIALDQSLPSAREPKGLGDASQMFIEVGAQLGLIILFADAFAKTFKFSLTGNVLETIPFALSVAGFSFNLMTKMGSLGQYTTAYWKGFSLMQSIPDKTGNITSKSSTTTEETLPAEMNNEETLSY